MLPCVGVSDTAAFFDRRRDGHFCLLTSALPDSEHGLRGTTFGRHHAQRQAALPDPLGVWMTGCAIWPTTRCSDADEKSY